jgi:NADPH-dependent 2,4-dienoyl-CoA reductase/sulfur reductase-like enzyme
MFLFKGAKSLTIAASVVTVFRIHSRTHNYPVEEPSKKPHTKKHEVVIIGAGCAGLGVAAQLLNEGLKDVVVIEPSLLTYYQPMWTLVGAGIKQNTESQRMTRTILHDDAGLISRKVIEIKPETNEIVLDDHSIISYDYLVIAAGIQTRWDLVPGLTEAINDPASSVVSIYGFDSSQKTWSAFQAFKGGKAIFTFPNSPIKCAGAPQKIMWLFEEYTRTNELRDTTTIEYWIPSTAMFGVKKYSDMLANRVTELKVDVNFQEELVSVDGKNKIATFKSLADGSLGKPRKGTLTKQKFDLLHVAPPFSPHKFLQEANKHLPAGRALTDGAGFVDVDKYSLQSKSYPNVFALGDCTNTPNSKTAAAVMSQAPVLVHNLTREMKNKPLDGAYNGYGSCPLMVSKNRVILAEF